MHAWQSLQLILACWATVGETVCLFVPAQDVAAVTGSYNPESEGETYCRALCRFANGKVATIEMLGCPSAVYVMSRDKDRIVCHAID
jgi:hypothetical protein